MYHELNIFETLDFEDIYDEEEESIAEDIVKESKNK
jgi:hypothetical protein